MTLRIGSRGPAVEALQRALAARGLYPWRVDGAYGPQTRRAVVALQHAHGLLPDGVAGPQTLGLLGGLAPINPEIRESPPAPAAAGRGAPGAAVVDMGAPLLHRCDPRVWAAWEALRDLVTGAGGGEPVRYGPGRGLWVPGRGWVVTRGPGRLGSDGWKSRLGRTYPSFHCSSWTNFLMGWLTCRNELYTHSGNIPPLDRLCTSSGEALHPQEGGAPWRGYGERCLRLSGRGRQATVTWREVVERSGELGTFNVFAQSTLSGGRWKWWHHTGLIVRDPQTGLLTRIAADGSAGAGRVYSGTPMDAEEVDGAYAGRAEGRVLLYLFRLRPNADGTFSADGRAPSPVSLE